MLSRGPLQEGVVILCANDIHDCPSLLLGTSVGIALFSIARFLMLILVHLFAYFFILMDIYIPLWRVGIRTFGRLASVYNSTSMPYT